MAGRDEGRQQQALWARHDVIQNAPSSQTKPRIAAMTSLGVEPTDGAFGLCVDQAQPLFGGEFDGVEVHRSGVHHLSGN
jgi:hypothetical protein